MKMKMKMTNTTTVAALAFVASASLLVAQEGKPAAPGAKTPAKADVQAEAAPVPSPPKELDQIKLFVGTWTCDGQANASEFGPAHKSRSTVKGQLDLGGYWLSGTVEETKTAETPRPMKGMYHWTYDVSKKQFVNLWVDNWGGWATQTSPGWQGDTMVWDGESNMMGQKMLARDTFTKKTDTQLTHKFELQLKGQWTTLGEETCKKSAGAAAKKP